MLSMTPFQIGLFSLGVFIVAWQATRAVRVFVLKRNVLDIPNERSSHSIPTPRGGGLAVVFVYSLVAVALGTLGEIERQWIPAILVGSIIAATGWWDDARGVSAGVRLGIQTAAAAAVVLYLESVGWMRSPVGVDLGIITIRSLLLIIPFLILFIDWMTNLYNFMDGVDGILGLQGLTVCMSAAVFCWTAEGDSLALLYFVFASVLGGFLVINWSPAKVFMGDVGSAFVGFMMAVFAIIGAAKGDLSFPAIVILHAAFIGDATYTLFVRLMRGQKPHQAHRSHFYQKMVRRGHPHSRVSLLFGAINFFWLTPLAYAYERWGWPALWCYLGAFAPVLALSVYYRAGIDLAPAKA